jgi:hypothetical protein
VSHHFALVREKLIPLDQALESALRVHALLLAVWTTLAAADTSDTTTSFPIQLVEALLRGLAASLRWALAFRMLAWMLARWTFVRLRQW